MPYQPLRVTVFRLHDKTGRLADEVYCVCDEAGDPYTAQGRALMLAALEGRPEHRRAERRQSRLEATIEQEIAELRLRAEHLLVQDVRP